MTRRELIDLCLSYPDCYEDYPFDSLDTSEAERWTLIRHRANKKTFAFIFEREGLCVNLKCEPMRSDLFRSALAPGVRPAYHMNKEHWNSVYPELISREDLEMFIDISFELTKPKSRRRTQTPGGIVFP